MRAARKPIPDLRNAAKQALEGDAGADRVGGEINELGNMAAYNPNGAEAPGVAGRDEGYLFWAAWLGAQRALSVPAAGRPRPLPAHLSDDWAATTSSDLLGASPSAPRGDRLSSTLASSRRPSLRSD